MGTTKGQEPGVKSTGRANSKPTVLSEILNTERPTQRAAYIIESAKIAKGSVG